MTRPALALSVAVAAVVANAVRAAICPSGVTAPPVTTLMASSTNLAREAWIVKPDCTFTAASLNNDGDLNLVDTSIEYIASIPTETQLLFAYARLSKGAELSGATKLKKFSAYGFGDGLVPNLKLPSTLTDLILMSGPVDTAKLKIPASVTLLAIAIAGISTLPKLPTGLQSLVLQSNKFRTFDFALPSTIETLDLRDNPIEKLEKISLPASLKNFGCSGCSITTVAGVQWPRQLTILNLKGTYSISTFEVRESDYLLFQTLTELNVGSSQSKCSDTTAIIQSINSDSFCVISDERFSALYGNGDDSTSTKTGSDANNDDNSASSTSGSDGSDTSDSTTDTQANGSRGVGSGNSTIASNGSSSKAGTLGSNPSADGRSSGSSSSSTSSGAINSTLLIALVVVSSVFAVLISIIGYRVFVSGSKKRKRAMKDEGSNNERRDPSTLTFSLSETPMADGKASTVTSQESADSAQEYLVNDIRTDKALIPLRIDQQDIKLSKIAARGGFGVIYRGSYQGRDVAVKQMLPDAWRNERMLSSFMDEIRMCASLEHPKIVEFIGVAWSSLRDLSVVIEFMAGGDLFAVLQRHAQSQSQSQSSSPVRQSQALPRPTDQPLMKAPQTVDSTHEFASASAREWSEPWTASRLQCKTSIARDVAEAMVYLHSFNSPILHRDLKARNVLLDVRGNAKLSDFGISREMSVDETMTSEIGTAAWIAPEVLRGERYSEKADIYSFGVLLVEMDRGCHPYADDVDLATPGESTSGGVAAGGVGRGLGLMSFAAHKNTQIAVMVSTGRLRPKVSRVCPEGVQSLVSRCLSFEAADRPTSMEVYYALRGLLKSFS